VTKRLEWYEDGWGRMHPDCRVCQDSYTISLRSAMASVGIERGMSTDAMAFMHLNDFHARGHRPN